MDNEVSSTVIRPFNYPGMNIFGESGTWLNQAEGGESNVKDSLQFHHTDFKVSPDGAKNRGQQSFERRSGCDDVEMLAFKTIPVQAAFSVRKPQEIASKSKLYGLNVPGNRFEKLRAILKSNDSYVKPKPTLPRSPMGTIHKVGQGNVFKYSVTRNKQYLHQTSFAGKHSGTSNDTPQPNRSPGLYDRGLQTSTDSGQRHSTVSCVGQHKETIEPKQFGPTSDTGLQEESDIRRQRFLRTKETLAKSGLLDVTMKTAVLMEKNRTLQTEIQELKQQVTNLLKSVFHNPENQFQSSESLNDLTLETTGACVIDKVL